MPTPHGLGQSEAPESACTGGTRSTLPVLGKLHRSQAEATWMLTLLSEVTSRIWAGAGRWGERTCRRAWPLKLDFGRRGRALFPSPLRSSFVFHSPTEEASSKRRGWGQSPPAQRQLPKVCVTAVMLFHSNKRQRRMTWGWCSSAPGLIGSGSGLNAKVSWQREAEKPDFPVPAPGVQRALGSGRQRHGVRSSMRGHWPSLRYTLLRAGPYPIPSSGAGMRVAQCGSQVATIGLKFAHRSASTCVPAGLQQCWSLVQLGGGQGKSLPSCGGPGSVIQWGLGKGCSGRSCAGRGELRACRQLCGQHSSSCPGRIEQEVLGGFGFT